MTYTFESVEAIRVGVLALLFASGIGLLKHLASRRKQRPFTLPVNPEFKGSSSQSNNGAATPAAASGRAEFKRRLESKSWRPAAIVGAGIALLANIVLCPMASLGPPLVRLFALMLGIGMLVLAGMQLLRLRNPSVTVQLVGRPPAVGGSFEIYYQLSGDTQRISSLTIDLVSREVANYGRGTTKVTREAEIWRVPAFATSSQTMMSKGALDVTVPADAMPSFNAPDNAIVWRFEFRGAVAMGPNLEDDFEVHVGSAP